MEKKQGDEKPCLTKLETETPRSDAPSVDESPFYDAADDTAAAVVEEEDADQETKQETEQDLQGTDDVEDQAGAPEELKVVVSIKEGRATIGVQRPSSDPHIESFDDRDLSGLAQEIPAVVERAKAQVGGRTQVSRSRETRSPGQAPAPARAGGGPGFKRPRERNGPAATGDAEAVLRATVGNPSPQPSPCSCWRRAPNSNGRRN